MNYGKRYKEDDQEQEGLLNKEQEELQEKYKEMLREIVNNDSNNINKIDSFFEGEKVEEVEEKNEFKEDKKSDNIETNIKEVELKAENKIYEKEDIQNVIYKKDVEGLTKKHTDLILEKIENEIGEERETEKLNEIRRQIEKIENESKEDEILILSKEKINKISDEVLFNIEQKEEVEDTEEKNIYNIDNQESKLNKDDEVNKGKGKKKEKIENNKIKKQEKKRKSMPKGLKVIGNIIYYITFLFVVALLLLVVVQRFSDNKMSIAGYRMFNILTGSMEPEYKVGDVLISKEIEPKDIQLGDDIVYLGKEKPFTDLIVTHRVVDLNREEDGSYSFITRGIANDVNDPIIKDSQVYGKIVYKVKVFSLLSKAINNMYVFFFVIFIPVVILVAIKIIQVKHENIEEADMEE